MSSVVLGAETPVNEWKDWLVLEVYDAEDTAAYSIIPSTASVREETRRGLYAFSTFLAKKHERY